MKFSINSTNLKNAVLAIFGVVDKKNTKPILTNLLIEGKKDFLEISATDLEVSSKILIDCSNSEDFEFCINAKNLLDILKELPEGSLNIEIQNEQTAIISYEKIEFTINTLPSENYPKPDFPKEKIQQNISSEFLSKIIYQTTHAISNDETRINMNGIFLQEVNKKIRAVATNGFVLAMIDYEQENINLKDGIIIPKKGIQELKKLIDSNKEKDLKIYVDNSFLYISIEDNFYFSVRLIAKDYVKYESVIPKKTVNKFVVQKDIILSAVKRIKILANEKSNAVNINLENGSMRVSAFNPNLGTAKEEFPVDYTGDDISIKFNAKYLIDTFTILEDEKISIEFNNEFTPVLIKNNSSDDFLGIVMPLRL